MNNRVNGDLAVSRSFGDFLYKKNHDLSPVEQQVSCDPDVRIIPRDEHDNYLLFACDGIWDVFSPEEVVTEVDNLLKRYETVEEAIAMFLHLTLQKGSKDNMTVLIVPFREAPV